MPSKGKGSKVAAAQARAKEAARKKSRQGGPVLPTAAYQSPPVDSDAETRDEQEEAQTLSLAPLRRPDSSALRPQAVRAIGQRRERHVSPLQAGASLKRELTMIGVLTATCGVVLAILKLATDLGA